MVKICDLLEGARYVIESARKFLPPKEQLPWPYDVLPEQMEGLSGKLKEAYDVVCVDP